MYLFNFNFRFSSVYSEINGWLLKPKKKKSDIDYINVHTYIHMRIQAEITYVFGVCFRIIRNIQNPFLYPSSSLCFHLFVSFAVWHGTFIHPAYIQHLFYFHDCYQLFYSWNSTQSGARQEGKNFLNWLMNTSLLSLLSCWHCNCTTASVIFSLQFVCLSIVSFCL